MLLPTSLHIAPHHHSTYLFPYTLTSYILHHTSQYHTSFIIHHLIPSQSIPKHTNCHIHIYQTPKHITAHPSLRGSCPTSLATYSTLLPSPSIPPPHQITLNAPSSYYFSSHYFYYQYIPHEGSTLHTPCSLLMPPYTFFLHLVHSFLVFPCHSPHHQSPS